MCVSLCRCVCVCGCMPLCSFSVLVWVPGVVLPTEQETILTGERGRGLERERERKGERG